MGQFCATSEPRISCCLEVATELSPRGLLCRHVTSDASSPIDPPGADNPCRGQCEKARLSAQPIAWTFLQQKQRAKKSLDPIYASPYIYTVPHTDPFQVIADPTRRRIVETLRDGEHQVGDVVKNLDIHQSGVSRHLRILLDAGFVQMRTDGQRHLYSLRPEPFRQLDGWLSAYRQLWTARLDRFEGALKRKQISKTKRPSPNDSELS